MTCNRFPLYISFLVIKLLTMIQNSASYPFAYVCSNTMFTTNSTYHMNLNTVFNSLVSNATNNGSGFHITLAGNHLEDTVYGLFLCRGDLTDQECGDCVSIAVQKDLPTKDCPNRKVAITWYDECMVRYSNESLFDRMDLNPAYYGWNPQNITQNVTSFKETIESLRNVVMEEAIIDRSGKKFGINVTSFTSETDISSGYGLAQCTPDLGSGECYQCLKSATSFLPISKGGRVFLPRCNIRYESYPFFNDATNQRLLPPPPEISPSSVSANSTKTLTSETSSPSEDKKVSTGVIIAVVAPVTAILLMLLILGICLFKRKAKKLATIAVNMNEDEDISLIESIQYDLDTLKSATLYFSEQNKLGQGGFGTVYKGILTNGQEIAVKKLSKSSTQALREFKNEALLLAKLQHRNLVKLLGFCVVGEEKLLVYEFVVNKSLDKFLFDAEKQAMFLDWETRHGIIQGIARGMLYLHQDSRLTIIHRDLKASNVLLDKNLNPKISDFGLARIFGIDQTQGDTSRIVGTYGYMSPEYAMHGQFSTKSDVYSFGVIVLEIISGKRNSSFYQTDKGVDLLSYTWQQWIEGSPMDLVDPTIRDSCSSHEVIRCINLGLLCVQESVSERPTMATIVRMLDSISVTLPVPNQPTFTFKSRSFSSFAKGSGSDKSSNKSAPWSLNDVSITKLEPR